MNVAISEQGATILGMKLSDVVKAARKRKGWSGRMLAKKAGTSGSVVSRLENNKQIGRADTVLSVTSALGLDPAYVQSLMAGGDAEAEPAERTPEEVLAELQAVIKRQRDREEVERKERERAEEVARKEQELRAQGLVGDVYRIPRAQQSVSAGYGYTLDAEMGAMAVPAPKVEDRISVRITGDCMEPDIPQGADVIVDKSFSPQNGDAVIVDHEGEWLCKWYEVQSDGTVWLIANQHREPIRPNGNTTIIGVVTTFQPKRPRKRP